MSNTRPEGHNWLRKPIDAGPPGLVLDEHVLKAHVGLKATVFTPAMVLLLCPEAQLRPVLNAPFVGLRGGWVWDPSMGLCPAHLAASGGGVLCLLGLIGPLFLP